MNVKLFNDNILVSELQDDMLINGVMTRYDSDSPYMFCEVEAVSDEALNYVNVGDILIIKRYAKEEYLSGYYFISFKDVRGCIPKEDYDKMLGGE